MSKTFTAQDAREIMAQAEEKKKAEDVQQFNNAIEHIKTAAAIPRGSYSFDPPLSKNVIEMLRE